MTSGLDSLTVELSAADAAILRRVQYELDRAHMKARFAAEPMEPGTKAAAADLVPLLIVVVAGLTEACKLVGILIEARTRQKPVIEVSVKNGDQHVKLTNAAPDDLRMIIEGHYRDSDGGA